MKNYVVIPPHMLRRAYKAGEVDHKTLVRAERGEVVSIKGLRCAVNRPLHLKHR